MPDQIDAKRLKAITNELVGAISSPPFVAAIKKLKATPVKNRVAVASKILTPTVLAGAGVRLPEGMRVTSRYFEPGSPDIIQVTDHGAAVVHVNSVPGTGRIGAGSLGLCACSGHLSVCAGAGGDLMNKPLGGDIP